MTPRICRGSGRPARTLGSGLGRPGRHRRPGNGSISMSMPLSLSRPFRQQRESGRDLEKDVGSSSAVSDDSTKRPLHQV